MISCHVSRLACPFTPLDHLLGLQNGTAHAMSVTPASLTATPVLMPLLMLCLCSSMPHLLLIHCSSLGTKEAQAPLVSGTKKPAHSFTPFCKPSALLWAEQVCEELELQQKGRADYVAESIQTTHPHIPVKFDS